MQPQAPHFQFVAEDVGLIRSLRELTRQAAFRRLSRGFAALGSNPAGSHPSPPSGKQNGPRKGAHFRFLPVRRVLGGGCSVTVQACLPQ
jgi:hypothetical protein